MNKAEKDTNVFDSEVHQILKEHWNVRETPKLIKRDYNVVYSAKDASNQELIVKARRVTDDDRASMQENEARQMKLIEALS